MSDRVARARLLSIAIDDVTVRRTFLSFTLSSTIVALIYYILIYLMVFYPNRVVSSLFMFP